jgi:hypothetical protein
MAERTGWSREFDEAIALLSGRKLVTLRDAANYITALPMDESSLPDWQAAIGALMLRTGRADHVRQDRRHASLEPQPRSGIQSEAERAALGPAQAEEGPLTAIFRRRRGLLLPWPIPDRRPHQDRQRSSQQRHR